MLIQYPTVIFLFLCCSKHIVAWYSRTVNLLFFQYLQIAEIWSIQKHSKPDSLSILNRRHGYLIYLCFVYFKVKILCHLHHDQLRAVFHVSHRISEAVSSLSLFLSLPPSLTLAHTMYIYFEHHFRLE